MPIEEINSFWYIKEYTSSKGHLNTYGVISHFHRVTKSNY